MEFVVNMDNYYFFGGQDKPQLAIALAPKGNNLAHELIPKLDGLNELPFELELLKSTKEKNGLIKSNDLSGLNPLWLDYQPNNVGAVLLSERIKNIIDQHLTGNEWLDWISAKVNSDIEQRIYYIPRFNHPLDVLDLEKTTFVEGTDHVIRSTFSSAKVKSYGLFPKPSPNELWKITTGIYVSEIIKNAINREKPNGIAFVKARVE